MSKRNGKDRQKLPADALEAVRQGRKVEAIKILREETGLGLANAKVLVDRASRIHGPVKSIPSFADLPDRPGALTWFLFFLFSIAAGLYFISAD